MYKYMYIWVVHMLLKRTHGHFFLLKARLSRVVSSDYSFKKVLLQTSSPNCEIIPVKSLFFKSQNITATGHYVI